MTGKYSAVVQTIPGYNLTLSFKFPSNETFFAATELSLNLTQTEYEKMLSWMLITFTDRVTPIWLKMITAIAGLIVNSVNILILSRPCMVSCVNMLLAAMEAVNLLVILTYMHNNIYKIAGTGFFLISFPARTMDIVNYFLSSSAISASMWLTVAIGLCRCVAVTWPLQASTMCTKRRSKIAIFFIVLLSCIFGVPTMIFNSYRKVNLTITNPTVNISTSKLAYFYAYSGLSELHDRVFFRIYIGLSIVNTAIPCIALSVFTVILVRSLFQAKGLRKQLCRTDSTEAPENKTTVMLLILLMSFLVTYCPSVFISVLMLRRGNDSDHMHEQLALFTEGIFILISNAATFFFYYFMSERFRATFHQLIRSRCGKKKDPMKDCVTSISSYIT